MVSSWLDTKPVPDLPTLSMDELLDVWAANRNSTQGTMAAEEVTRRQFNARTNRRGAQIDDPSKM